MGSEKRFSAIVILLILLIQPKLSAQHSMMGQKDEKTLKVLKQSMDHYLKVKMDSLSFRPLADRDKRDLDKDLDSMEYNTYSETASYVLLRLICCAEAFPDSSAYYKSVFDKVWNWTFENLQRSNIDSVYFCPNSIAHGNNNYWLSRSEIMSNDKYKAFRSSLEDHLFAWRFYEGLGGRAGGIILSDSADKRGIWVDGLDAASDADQDIAFALLKASEIWKDGTAPFDYSVQARLIIADIWDKEVKYVDPLRIDISEWYPWTNKNTEGKFIRRSYEVDSEGRTFMSIDYDLSFEETSYSGFSKTLSPGGIDMSELKEIEIEYFYSPSAEGCDKLQLLINRSDGSEVYSDATLSEGNPEEKPKKARFSFNDNSMSKITKLSFQLTDSANCPDPRSGVLKIFSIRIIHKPEYKDTIPRPYLVAGDKFAAINGLNPSYFRPSYYGRYFHDALPRGSWDSLKTTSYQVLLYNPLVLHYIDGAKQNVEIVGTKRIPPNWVSIAPFFQLCDNEWMRNDFMSGWDAFRTYFWVAQDYTWSGNADAENYLNTSNNPNTFLQEKAAQHNALHLGYLIDGNNFRGCYYDSNAVPLNENLLICDTLDTENWGSYGSYLAYFCAKQGDPLIAPILQLIKAKLDSMYDSTGYWRPISPDERRTDGPDPDSLDYFGQNWAWFGIAACEGCCVTNQEPADASPEKPWLGAVTPNPARNAASFTYFIPSECNVRITIFDLLGRTIESRHIPNIKAGASITTLDLAEYPSGIYLLQMTAGSDLLRVPFIVRK